MAAPVDALVELEDGPPASVALHGTAGNPGLGLEPAPHVARADRTAGGGLAAGVNVRIGWIEFAVAGTDEGVGQVVGTVVRLHVTASAAIGPVGGDGGYWWGGEGTPVFDLQGGGTRGDNGCGGHARNFEKGWGGDILHAYLEGHGRALTQSRPGASGGAGYAEAAGAGADPDPDPAAADGFTVDDVGLVK